MASLGNKFQSARETQGLTLEQMVARTRIQETHLKALEADSFEQLPERVFTKGFVRAYARSLKLDEEACLQLFAECSASFYKKEKENEGFRKMFLRKENAQKGRPSRAMIGLLVGGLLLLGGMVLLQQQSPSKSIFPNFSQQAMPPHDEVVSKPEKSRNANDIADDRPFSSSEQQVEASRVATAEPDMEVAETSAELPVDEGGASPSSSPEPRDEVVSELKPSVNVNDGAGDRKPTVGERQVASSASSRTATPEPAPEPGDTGTSVESPVDEGVSSPSLSPEPRDEVVSEPNPSVNVNDGAGDRKPTVGERQVASSASSRTATLEPTLEFGDTGTPAESSIEDGTPTLASPTPALTPPDSVAIGSEDGQEDGPLILELRTLETTWVQVRSDESFPHEALLHAGEVARWEANKRFLLTLGNAGGVEVRLNGQLQGPFGETGVVVRDVELKP